MIKNSVDFSGNNPYTLSFGKQPYQIISRTSDVVEVLESFNNSPATHQMYMITGVRGSGKTVLMTDIRDALKQSDEWAALELSTSQNLLASLSQILYKDNHIGKILKHGSGVSLMGFGVQLNSSSENVSYQIAIADALEKFKKQGKKLLVCIDEIVVNDYVKEFASIFQILIRDDLPIYLLMTGLYENISDLKNEKNLTFLYRAPQIRLKPLNLGTIAENYMNTLGVKQQAAEKMSALTKGYSFAFQVLGYYTYRYNGNYIDAITEYRQYLEDYSYEKIWSDLSRSDKRLLYAIAESRTGKAKEIKEIIGIENNEYTPYRDRLIKKMIVNGDEYGYLKITLPLFDDYVKRCYRMEEI